MSSHGTQNGCLPLHVAPGLQPSPFKGEFRKKVAYIKKKAGLNGYTETTIDQKNTLFNSISISV
jgi:hypothetical protein